MSDLAKTLIMVNPAAGSGRAREIWDRLLARRPELGRARLILTAGAESALDELDAGLDAGAERLIVIGGDGTVNLVANRLLARGHGERIALGLLRAGTGSDLTRFLGLPRRPGAALDILLEATPRPIDAIEIVTGSGERHFVVNIASAGLSGAVDEMVNSIHNRGRLTYIRASITALLRYRAAPCRVVVDGEVIWDDPFFLLILANGQYFGKGMRAAPRAEIDDGKIDVVLVPPLPLWQLPYRMPQFYTGHHLGIPGVLHRRARLVRVEPKADMPPYDVDGEILPAAPADFRILPGALRILTG